MDCASYGDLGRLIKTFKAQNHHFSRDQLLCLLVQSSEGLGWAHTYGKVHFDLKP